MKFLSEYKENRVFEAKLRDTYPENVCDIVIEWIEEGISCVFKETYDKDLFIFGNINRNTKEIKFSNDYYTLEEVIYRIMKEMEFALDENGSENPELIKEEYDLLDNALKIEEI